MEILEERMHQFKWNQTAEFLLGKLFGKDRSLHKLKGEVEKNLSKKISAGETTEFDKPRGRRAARIVVSGKKVLVEFGVSVDGIYQIQAVESGWE